jgi:hypothetical protein
MHEFSLNNKLIGTYMSILSGKIMNTLVNIFVETDNILKILFLLFNCLDLLKR